MCIRDSLYAINGGIDEKTKMQVGPEYTPITSEYLDYDEVIKKYDTMMDWLAHLYVCLLYTSPIEPIAKSVRPQATAVFFRLNNNLEM